MENFILCTVIDIQKKAKSLQNNCEEVYIYFLSFLEK